ncbi:hypothetical protein KC360_g370 [Hortaea werneckii]|nr:hypothetical protein KC325_g1695 [Hortaea werneckii]KAI6998840.1 hypothetical protein KC359_g2075 [Hortaea werneckii]KAI7083300.1 hypothetical protein KC356_g7686 [Hortaea werneckii]KAI7149312.1 hypothetical protein KC344_g1049 [Hortaea werneckii]KAI7180097.1 hypothetical protein KC360_g370 [Hortaea werneckii]
MESNLKPRSKDADQQHNTAVTTTTDDDETTRHHPSPHHPQEVPVLEQQEAQNTDRVSPDETEDLPIIERRRPSEAETKLVREYGGKENLREKTKLSYHERDIDPGADTPQEEKSFAEGVVGEMDVEAQERKFHLGGFEKGVKKNSGKSG